MNKGRRCFAALAREAEEQKTARHSLPIYASPQERRLSIITNNGCLLCAGASAKVTHAPPCRDRRFYIGLPYPMMKPHLVPCWTIWCLWKRLPRLAYWE